MVSELSAPSIKMGLLNAHSTNNKLPWLSEFIKKRDLMVLAITETFLKTIEQAQRLCKGLPDGIQVHQQPRNLEDSGKKSGGGVGIASSNELESTRVQLDKSFKSFEYVAANLRHKEWDRPIKTTTVYRRPGYDVIPFLEDFKEYLENFFENDSILITGDFNIKVNDEKYKPATRFKELLNRFGLKQKVTKGTQKKGNILDLVITRNVEIADLSVEETDNQKLDHYAVIFNACPTSKDTPKKRYIQFPEITDPPRKQFKDREKQRQKKKQKFFLKNDKVSSETDHILTLKLSNMTWNVSQRLKKTYPENGSF
ncbi:uncharacterized protein LOC110965914 [Acanthochromis polyacanthus]|uniref:uncharacterized protein LOC110965914 n=1 Tax=Acanthochromis polyacanthus TaxID=80966 RepID=UPI0022343501|nr:uncharacterized protein LOC110965914 [Acanthochromis polyacanthus]